MGVDDELLKSSKKSFPTLPLDVPPPPLPAKSFPDRFDAQIRTRPVKNTAVNFAGQSDSAAVKALRADIQRLTVAIKDLLQVFEKAQAEMAQDPASQLGEKIDKLIGQNEEIARSVLLLLELNRQHLPDISRNTRISKRLELRKPRQLFEK